MARPHYRRRHGPYDTWHFCTNCTNWPTSTYEMVTTTPTTGEFCNQCLDKEKNGNCS